MLNHRQHSKQAKIAIEATASLNTKNHTTEDPQHSILPEEGSVIIHSSLTKAYDVNLTQQYLDSLLILLPASSLTLLMVCLCWLCQKYWLPCMPKHPPLSTPLRCFGYSGPHIQLDLDLLLALQHSKQPSAHLWIQRLANWMIGTISK